MPTKRHSKKEKELQSLFTKLFKYHYCPFQLLTGQTSSMLPEWAPPSREELNFCMWNRDWSEWDGSMCSWNKKASIDTLEDKGAGAEALIDSIGGWMRIIEVTRADFLAHTEEWRDLQKCVSYGAWRHGCFYNPQLGLDALKAIPLRLAENIISALNNQDKRPQAADRT